MLNNAAKNLMLDALGGEIKFVSLHTGDPGATGTNEVSGGAPAYARKAITWNAASGANLDSSNAPVFDVPGGGTEISYYGLWSADEGGTFYGSDFLRDGDGDPVTETFGGQGTYALLDMDVNLLDPEPDMSASFTLPAGDTIILAAEARDEQGALVDLAGAQITWALAKASSSQAVLVEKVIGSGIVIVDAAAGRFDVMLSEADTDSLEPGAYYHEAEVRLGAQVYTVFRAQATIEATLIR